MLSYIIGTKRNMDSMISDIFSLLDLNDIDQFRSVNRYVCNQFAWIAILAGYDTPVFRYVEKKINYYYRYVINLKHTHKHAPNIL